MTAYGLLLSSHRPDSCAVTAAGIAKMVRLRPS